MTTNHNTSKRILVTGGAGFLGSHLCEKLLAQPNTEVVCLDNFSTGQFKNIEPFLNTSRFKFLHHDVTEPIFLEVDEIYSLACPASPVQYQKDPIQTLKTNVQGTINLLELAKQVNAKLLLSSTSEVYGDPLVHPQTESYWGHVNPLGIRACYDEGKRCAETLCYEYYRRYAIEIKIARIFNTYGPRMHAHDGRVVSNFIMQALQNKEITIYGDGSQTRSFCYVDDLINGLQKLMNSPSTVVGPINLGNPSEHTVREIALKIIELTHSQSKISLKTLPLDDPKRRQPDISLAKKELKWTPKIDLEQGLIRTIHYFSNAMNPTEVFA
jgi:UDP-glucuronate decarboxylase